MGEFIDARGLTIVYDVHPADKPRAIVQFAHGYGEHVGRYEKLFAELTSHGYIVYANDHRGHGRTGIRQHDGDVAKLGRLGRGGVVAAVDALEQLTGIIRDEHPELPLILMGQSWGSFMAQMLMNRHPDHYDALVLSATVLRQLGSGNLGDLNKAWNAPNATGMEWLSRDPATVRGFIDDPLCTTVPMGKNFGLHRQLRMLGLPSRKLRPGTPVLLMVGHDDAVGGPVSVHKLANAFRTRSKLTDVTTLVFPDDRHEIFNEPDQAEVRADLLAWLDARFPVRD